MINPGLHLWRAVLVAGLHDAAKGIQRDWLGSPDFVIVCYLAQIDPQAVLTAYRPAKLMRRPTIAA